MSKTKNIFSYATKELSQDAFLRWLFENWNSNESDVREASRKLIKKIIGKDEKKDINIMSLKTHAQDHKIDILVDCVIDNESYIIAIEDKTTSFEHSNQINTYKNYVEKTYPNHNKKYIFYKTYLLTNDEKANIKKQNWELYDICTIHNIFNSLKVEVKNSILKDYIEHIKNLHEDLTGVLSNDISKWNDHSWVNFCVNHKPDVPENIVFGFGNFHNQYIYLVFNLKKPHPSWNEHPYGEIRSRDFRRKNHKNKFMLRILIYGIDKEILDTHLDVWKNKFKESKDFLIQKNSKQIAISKDLENISSVSELKLLLEKYMKIYQEIVL